jgi:hypothetical protein
MSYIAVYRYDSQRLVAAALNVPGIGFCGLALGDLIAGAPNF